MNKALTVTLDLDYVVGERGPIDDEGRAHGGPITVLDAIITEGARQVVDRLGDSAKRELRRRVDETVKDVVRERVTAAVDEALNDPYQPTNTFGEPKGDPVTLRSTIADLARKQLEVRAADRRGYGRDSDTVMETVLRREVAVAVRKELDEEIKTAKQQVAERIREEGAQVITEMVSRAAGVNRL